MPKLFPGYKDEIKKKIANEAFAIFLEKGFEKTMMDDIAARLGVTKPALYRYYKNKEELFIASMGDTMLGGYRMIFATSFASDDPITGAGNFFDALLVISSKYSVIRKDLEYIISRNPSLHQEIAGMYGESLVVMRDVFQEHKRKGKIHTTMEETDLAFLCGVVAQGLINNVDMGLDPAEAKRLWLLCFTKLSDAG
ncbi:TetR/AcrR family transcriptional regulator [Methanosphaerula palustris]|uniref:Transcriptional regulator, TetR family n=1 Tax=Methanosphaerula palustris (strain ATCC BAA-1556 / DSM 19958 / E1-9c) TaxID=521011 RepID=B8GIK6_METPE|nr:TetR family transcriptional regulator [Methanosphaerula palustris]ACL16819.1 transcriptional regulator, TetR family [Methanosphaerula palustris E1-9c]